MSKQGQALIDILIKVSGVDDANRDLKAFFDGIANSANAFSNTIKAASDSLESLTKGTNRVKSNASGAAKGIGALSEKTADLARAAEEADNRLKAVNKRIREGIALSKLGIRADKKAAYDRESIAMASDPSKRYISDREAARAMRNVENLRKAETLKEAQQRAKLSVNPLRDHLNNLSKDLSNKLEKGTLSLVDATRKYKRELLSLDRQGVYTNQAQKAKDLERGINRLAAAQQRHNQKSLDASANRGASLANPAAGARATLSKNMVALNDAYARGLITHRQFKKAATDLNKAFKTQYTTMGKLSGKWTAYGHNITDVSHRMRSAGRQMIIFGGLALAALRPLVVQNAKFEQSVSDVMAVMNDTGPSTLLLQRLSDQFLVLGETSEFTAVQVAEAAKELALAGFTAREVEKSIASVVDLSSASGVALEDAARIAANITRAFQLSADSFGIVSDKLVAIANNANTTVEALSESFKYVSPIAASLGQSIDDVGAALGVMANSGMKGCFDPLTDVLTQRGWIPWSEATKDDVYATVNKETHQVEWHKPLRMFAYHHKGDMYKVVNHSVDMLVTPNHNMYVATGRDRSYVLELAASVFGKTYSILLDDGFATVEHSDQEWVPYSGMVYCAEVPNNTLIVRRNGKVHVSGNSRAGTGLSRAFSEMIEKADQFDVVLKRAGSSFALVNPEEVGLGDAIKELERVYRLGRLTTKDLSDMFDQRSFRAIITLINQGGDAFDNLKEKIEDASGLAEKTKEARLDTLYGDYLKFTSALTSFFIELGETTNSTFRDILVYARLWITSLKEAIDQNTAWVKSWIEFGVAVSSAIALLGVLTSSVGALLTAGGALIGLLGLVGAPLAALAVALGLVVALFVKWKAAATLATAAKVRAGITEITKRFQGVKEAIRQSNKELDKYQEKLQKITRLSSLKPVELNSLIESGGAGLGDTSGTRANLQASAQNIAAEYQTVFKEFKKLKHAEKFPILAWLTGDPLSRSDRRGEIEKRIAQLKTIESSYKDVAESVRRLDSMLKSEASSLSVQAMDYAALTVEVKNLDKAILEQEKTVAGVADLAATGDENAKRRLTVEQLQLEALQQRLKTANDLLATDSRMLPLINEIARTATAYNEALASGEPEANIAKAALAQTSALQAAKQMTIQISEETEAADKLATRLEDVAKIEKERAEANMSEREKALAALEEQRKVEKASLDLAIASLAAKKNLTEAQQKNTRGAEFDALEEILKGDANNRGIIDQLAEMVNKAAQLDKNYIDLAASSNAAFDDKLVQTMDEGSLKIAQLNGNILEQIRLTEKLAQAKIKLDSQSVEESARADYVTQQQKILALEMAKTSTNMVDESNLELAKKTGNLKEEIRLTELLGKKRIDENAAQIADGNLRAEYIASQTTLLNAELDEIKSSRAKQEESKLKELDSAAGQMLKQRIAGQDKITDALTGQVKTLQDAVFLNAYLLRLERMREASKERARKKAISGAFSLQNAMQKGVSQRTLANRFSDAAALYDNARQMGVSSVALTPAAGMLQAGLPAVAPAGAVPNRMPNAGDVNSNNTTVTIAPGAIVVNGDDATVAEKIMEQIVTAFGGKLPKK